MIPCSRHHHYHQPSSMDIVALETIPTCVSNTKTPIELDRRERKRGRGRGRERKREKWTTYTRVRTFLRHLTTRSVTLCKEARNARMRDSLFPSDFRVSSPEWCLFRFIFHHISVLNLSYEFQTRKRTSPSF